MYDLIYVYPKQACIDIAMKNCPASSKDIESALWNLPDDIFDSVVTCEFKRGRLYHTTKGFNIPDMFTRPCYATTEIQDIDRIQCSIGHSTISPDIYIGTNPWILKIDADTTQITVNPDVRDMQKDALVKEILSALDNYLLKNYRMDRTIEIKD